MRALILLLLAIAAPALADPFLIANAYKADGTEPDACTLPVTGGPVAVPTVTCTLPAVTGGVQPKCDLGGISVVGTYTLTLTCSRQARIVNGTNGGTVTPAATAAAAPFSYTLNAGAIVSPANQRLTAQ